VYPQPSTDGYIIRRQPFGYASNVVAIVHPGYTIIPCEQLLVTNFNIASIDRHRRHCNLTCVLARPDCYKVSIFCIAWLYLSRFVIIYKHKYGPMNSL